MSSVYEVITNRIIEILEKGVVPWSKPWKTLAMAPRSLTTQRPYRGVNFLLTVSEEFESPYWLTYQQARELGAQVRKGERGTPIIFFSKKEVNEDAKGETRDRLITRYYTVFNAAQVDGLAIKHELLYPTAATSDIANNIETAERIVKGYVSGPAINIGFVKAAFDPTSDVVMMPRQEVFRSGEEYYSTLFHELVHSTGIEKRLNRESLKKIASFGDEDYSREELVAEIGSALLCAEAGIVAPVIENQSAYIGGWLKSLKADTRAVIIAAAQAQKATDYILARCSESLEKMYGERDG